MLFVQYISAWILQPASGIPITGTGVVICKYPSDPTVILGYLSVLFLAACTMAGWYSLFYPYKGKFIPRAALFRNKGFSAFFVALGTTGLAVSFLLWPTLHEQFLHVNNVQQDSETGCPTAKTGLIGGGAFLSLDSCLFWLIALMLARNAGVDYFGESDDDDVTLKGIAP